MAGEVRHLSVAFCDIIRIFGVTFAFSFFAER